MRKLLVLLMALFLFMGFATEGSASSTIKVSKRFLENQTQSIMTYEKLLDKFEVKKNGKYPGYYSGSVIDKEGKLLILVTKSDFEAKEKIKNLLEDDFIQIQSVDYSLNYLIKLQEDINELKVESDFVVNSVSIDILNNGIKVGLANFTTESTNEMNDLLKTSVIECFQESKVNTETTYVAPGQAVKIIDDLGKYDAASMAFPAKRYISGSWQYGFVTTAHFSHTGAPEAKLVLGSPFIAINRLKALTSIADASFFETYTGVSASHVTSTGVILNSAYTGTSIPPGTYVCKEGASTGRTCGWVVDGNHSFQPTVGPYHTNFVQASYSSAGGDSGGIVYIPDSSFNTGQVLGVHTAAGGRFCYYKNVLDELGVQKDF